ncbi:MAG: ATP-binding cassette domain-containing protein [Halobacteriota archaeon]|nr:ATP-binding cassette domain-containing protein [Halobacteriota archaeon]
MRKAIEVKGLSYNYPDGTEALKDVSFDVFEGESAALIGPNGAGKSTLLLHLNGVLRNEDGAVKIFGDRIHDKSIRKIRRRVGIVFQDPDDQLFMPTVFDDVAFGPLNLGFSREEVEERVDMALRRVGLSGYENRSPHHMSFGEKKRASFATVLSMDPDVLVLDEPTSNLDPKSRTELIKTIKDLNDEGKTIITATHDLNALADISGRVLVLNRTIVDQGTTREIFENQDLLKEMNLDVPEVVRLFEVLKCFGYDYDNLPLSIEEAISHLTATIESEGGHVHLHIHEHTHERLNKARERHNHHVVKNGVRGS